ncbi:phycobilisome protein [Stanieria cyanosphaera PCC 7437]|uniref:Phycobilisome protein n=1 Tax=Stanieria cyanosphaera (strain ATCC 29371 / PCC 7437) TaxID=111780 RepID=K9XYC6_STAC7|nr:phycobilisome protein [Stanieria cyanosphaera]AFZ37116.1 phycobilisome protein [Stanieria cyanosphaera PCC 7437]
MLTQLTRLSLEVDGRYATDQELQFLEEYLDSVDLRIRTYEKIRDHEAEIIPEVEAKMRALNQNNQLFVMGDYEIEICRRDRKNAICYSCTAMLMDDLDRLREGTLIWFQTIVRAIGWKRYVQNHYPTIQEVIKNYLTPEEAELIMVVFQVEHNILGLW